MQTTSRNNFKKNIRVFLNLNLTSGCVVGLLWFRELSEKPNRCLPGVCLHRLNLYSAWGFSLNAFSDLCVYCLCIFSFFYARTCLPTPNLLAAARSKATGERASPAALPSHPAHRARIPPAPHSHPPAGQEPRPRGQWARHTADAQRQHPTHPVHPLDACPGSQQQHAGVGGGSGAGGAGACLWEPRSRERFWFLRGWKWTDWGRSSHSCRSGSTEWDCLHWSFLLHNIHFIPFQFSAWLFFFQTYSIIYSYNM